MSSFALENSKDVANLQNQLRTSASTKGSFDTNLLNSLRGRVDFPTFDKFHQELLTTAGQYNLAQQRGQAAHISDTPGPSRPPAQTFR